MRNKSSKHRSSKQVKAKKLSGLFPKIEAYEVPFLLFSIFATLFAFIFVKFTNTLLSSFLLFVNKVPFSWSPLRITNISSSWQYWSEESVFLVYLIPPLTLHLTGWLLAYKLNKRKNLTYRERLILVWIAFFLTNWLPGGFIAGAFIFDGLGVIFAYLLFGSWQKALFLFIPAAYFMASRKFWRKLFMESAPHNDWLAGHSNRYKYSLVFYVLPFILLAVLTLLTTILNHHWYPWLSLPGMALLFIFNKSSWRSRYKTKSVKYFNSSPSTMLTIIFISILWLFLITNKLIHFTPSFN